MRCCARSRTPRHCCRQTRRAPTSSALLRDAELVDLVTGAPPTMHWRRQLEQTLSDHRRQHDSRVSRDARPASRRPALAALGEFRSSLADLKDLDSEALSQLMQGTLDLSAHRLDAWVTSVATKRLAVDAHRRTDGPVRRRLRLGGESQADSRVAGEAGDHAARRRAGTAADAANDSGFIHAPSMTHAATAALLRNAHLGPTRRAERRRTVRDRSVVAARARSLAAARRRAPGSAAGRAPRLSRRTPAPRHRRRQRPQHGSLHRAAAPAWRRSSPARVGHDRAGRHHRRQQRRRRPGAASPLEGRAQHGRRGAEQGGHGHERPRRRSRRSSTGSATRSTA